MSNIIEENNSFFEKLGLLLNINASAINKRMVADMIERTGLDENTAVKFLVAEFLGLDISENSQDKATFNKYVVKMLKCQDRNVFADNPYYKSIKFFKLKNGDIEFKLSSYNPYELFVYDDIVREPSGRLIPQVGYFKEEFVYPAIYEKGVLWMSVTPNEINTMREPILNAFGRVLTFGLGLGYFAFMVSLKENVKKVTIIETNQRTIEIFKRYILPQFKFANKIEIIKQDAFEFAKYAYRTNDYDYVFADIWHDAGDGVDCYLKFKKLECLNKNILYDYWIEKTIKCYLE